MSTTQHDHYLTRGGVRIKRLSQSVPYTGACERLQQQLDTQRGLLLNCTVEFPGRYQRKALGFVNPPLAITAIGRAVEIKALNARGVVLLPELQRAMAAVEHAEQGRGDEHRLCFRLPPLASDFDESRRSRQPSVFSVLRAVIAHFASPDDAHLGLYGAFGYDLAFQFEPVQLRLPRPQGQRDLVLYLPDELLLLDHQARSARVLRYDFVCRRRDQGAVVRDSQQLETTGGLARSGRSEPWLPASASLLPRDEFRPGEYAALVEIARHKFQRGELFEVVPGQLFRRRAESSPAQIHARLQAENPAPYGALINLGEQEHLVAASPEMYVRVRQNQVESCPISGTIRRGADAMEDAEQIRRLLNSTKDEAELSMCTDVDRNDKARVCVPGSVRLLGRRQVELYSRLIHTVDHVVGELAPGYDALDAFLSHTWAVTVTGAPKAAAMQFLEDHEKSARGWYGGAFGFLGFDGSMDTGLTLRTLRIADGVAEVRAGATLLYDSCPEEEEAETQLKASALLAALRAPAVVPSTRSVSDRQPHVRVLLVDHRDSFVHNLGACLRQSGASLSTLRPHLARAALQSQDFDLVVLSPGPGRPDDFQLRDTLSLSLQRGFPVFGVCLGLQAMVEYFGGTLRQLPQPMHGKASLIQHHDGSLFTGLPTRFAVGRYHSLVTDQLPDVLCPLAETVEDGLVMALAHRSLPLVGVQFHPESILSQQQDNGLRLIRNLLRTVMPAGERVAVQRMGNTGLI